MKKTSLPPLPDADAHADGPPAAGDLPVCNNTSLRRAARRLGNLYDDAMAPHGITGSQLALMVEIERMKAEDAGREPTLQDLAARLAIQISALTHALRPLVRDGLVEPRVDEHDKRVKRAGLTPAGAARLRAAGASWMAVNQRVEHVLGVESAAALRALADHVASDDFLAAFEAAGASND